MLVIARNALQEHSVIGIEFTSDVFHDMIGALTAFLRQDDSCIMVIARSLRLVLRFLVNPNLYVDTAACGKSKLAPNVAVACEVP